MKKLTGLLILVVSITTFAEGKIKMDFNNQEIDVILKHYSVASGQKFVIDSTVRGRATILSPNEISLEEAYNQLSEVLAINGFAIVKNGDWLTVKNARSAQRDNIEISKDLPTGKPQRLATWVINLKNIAAQDVAKELRVLTSSYGELVINTANNQLIITDWTSNLQRVSELIKQVDKPADPSISKIVDQAKKEHKETKEVKKTKTKDGELTTKKTETTETTEK